jgi:PAS domain-containing protein
MSELERFRLLLDQADNPIVLMDLSDGRVVDANAAARRCLGWKPETGATVDIREWLGIDPLAALDGTAAADDSVLLCIGDQERTMEISYSRAEIDGHGYGVIVAHDIRERKEAQERLRLAHERLQANYTELEELYGQLGTAEEALKHKVAELESSNAALAESEARYRLATEGSKDGIWEWDIRKGRISVTEAWAAAHGFPVSAAAEGPEESLRTGQVRRSVRAVR